MRDCCQASQQSPDEIESLFAFAWECGSPGDVDGDGSADLACTAPSYTARIYSGKTGEPLWSRSFAGFDLNGEGTTLVGAGDLDGDGRSEWLLGANDSGLMPDQGSVDLCSAGELGHRWPPRRIGRLANSSGKRHMTEEGMDVCGLGGDANGDEVPDFVLYQRLAGSIRPANCIWS